MKRLLSRCIVLAAAGMISAVTYGQVSETKVKKCKPACGAKTEVALKQPAGELKSLRPVQAIEVAPTISVLQPLEAIETASSTQKIDFSNISRETDLVQEEMSRIAVVTPKERRRTAKR